MYSVTLENSQKRSKLTGQIGCWPLWKLRNPNQQDRVWQEQSLSAIPKTWSAWREPKGPFLHSFGQFPVRMLNLRDL